MAKKNYCKESEQELLNEHKGNIRCFLQAIACNVAIVLSILVTSNIDQNQVLALHLLMHHEAAQQKHLFWMRP